MASDALQKLEQRVSPSQGACVIDVRSLTLQNQFDSTTGRLHHEHIVSANDTDNNPLSISDESSDANADLDIESILSDGRERSMDPNADLDMESDRIDAIGRQNYWKCARDLAGFMIDSRIWAKAGCVIVLIDVFFFLTWLILVLENRVPIQFARAYNIIDWITATAFLAEALLRLISYGFDIYFRSTLRAFDILISATNFAAVVAMAFLKTEPWLEATRFVRLLRMIMILAMVRERTFKWQARNQLEELENLLEQERSNQGKLTKWRIESDAIAVGESAGEGGFGAVHLGLFRGTLVAVKQLFNANREGSETSIEEEAVTLVNLRHPNVVLFMGFVHEPNKLWIVTEYCSRGSLRDLLDDKNMTLTHSRILKFALGAARGLAYLHGQDPRVLHLDLKTSNILISSGWDAKLADFGLARSIDNIQNSTFAGTIQYSAPEILESNEFGTPADIYAFGICLWEMAARQVPFHEVPKMDLLWGVVHDHLRPDLNIIHRREAKVSATLEKMTEDNKQLTSPKNQDFSEMISPVTQDGETAPRSNDDSDCSELNSSDVDSPIGRAKEERSNPFRQGNPNSRKHISSSESSSSHGTFSTEQVVSAQRRVQKHARLGEEDSFAKLIDEQDPEDSLRAAKKDLSGPTSTEFREAMENAPADQLYTYYKARRIWKKDGAASTDEKDAEGKSQRPSKSQSGFEMPMNGPASTLQRSSEKVKERSSMQALNISEDPAEQTNEKRSLHCTGRRRPRLPEPVPCSSENSCEISHEKGGSKAFDTCEGSSGSEGRIPGEGESTKTWEEISRTSKIERYQLLQPDCIGKGNVQDRRGKDYRGLYSDSREQYNREKNTTAAESESGNGFFSKIKDFSGRRRRRSHSIDSTYEDEFKPDEEAQESSKATNCGYVGGTLHGPVHMSKDYIALIERCWAHDPRDRPSADEVVWRLVGMIDMELRGA